MSTLYSLTSEQLSILKYLSILGLQFSIPQVSFFFNKKQIIDQLSKLHILIFRGLIKPVGDEFCFNHILIREIVNEEIKDKERLDLQSIYNEWQQSQVIRK